MVEPDRLAVEKVVVKVVAVLITRPAAAAMSWLRELVAPSVRLKGCIVIAKYDDLLARGQYISGNMVSHRRVALAECLPA